MKKSIYCQHCGAFTLVESLVTIASIALLLAALIPSLSVLARAAKKGKDASQISDIEKAMFTWASGNKENQFPPLKCDSPTRYGGGVNAAFQTLLNGPSSGLISVSACPLSPALFICPVAHISPMVPCGADATGQMTVYDDRSFYDGPVHCSYGVLNGGELNQGKIKGNHEGRNNNCRAIVPLIYNALNSSWHTPDGQPICDWNRVATGNAGDWKGHIGWGDGHVKFSETPVVTTTMNGKTYPRDDLNGCQDVGPNGDAIMGISTSLGSRLACNEGGNSQSY